MTSQPLSTITGSGSPAVPVSDMVPVAMMGSGATTVGWKPADRVLREMDELMSDLVETWRR